MKYKNKEGQWKTLLVEPSGDTLPIGAIVEFNGTQEEIPYGYEYAGEDSGTINVTTDINAAGDNAVPTTRTVKKYVDEKQAYSTEETVVGKWIDGKPIYRKIVDIGDLPNNTNKYITHNINIETPIKCSGICYNPSASMRFTLPMPNTNIWLDVNQICVLTTVDRTNTNAKAIIEYTKTTD